MYTSLANEINKNWRKITESFHFSEISEKQAIQNKSMNENTVYKAKTVVTSFNQFCMSDIKKRECSDRTVTSY